MKEMKIHGCNSGGAQVRINVGGVAEDASRGGCPPKKGLGRLPAKAGVVFNICRVIGNAGGEPYQVHDLI
jgi:hypothetical protein